MIRYFSQVISIACTLIVITVPLGALYLLVDIELFSSLAERAVELPIRWETVTEGQWYLLWMLTLLYASLGLVGLYFLRRPFANFARGELFNSSNSRDLRLFSIFLFAQGLAGPLHFSLTSLLLSINHPVGERMLSVSVGSDELSVIALAMILWVLSDLLVKASQLESENKQFV